MFWGVTLNPGKLYQQVVKHDLHITQAALHGDADASWGKQILKLKIFKEESHNEFVLGTLRESACEQLALDLVFDAGTKIGFEIVGNSTVSLVGYYIEAEPGSDRFFGSISELSDSEDSDFEDEKEDSEVNSSVDSSLESPEKKPRAVKKQETPHAAPAKEEAAQPVTATKRKTPAKKDKKAKKMKQEAPKQPETPQKQETEAKVSTPEKGAAVPQANKSPKSTPKQTPKTPKSPKDPRDIVQSQDTKVGSGPTAKKGNKVVVRYVGRLPNGKIFDQTQNRPFTFTIGRGEVIKGWDMGFEGMQVGGHRTMIIPSKFGYGAKGAPPSIPPHTNLTFDVELVAIK